MAEQDKSLWEELSSRDPKLVKGIEDFRMICEKAQADGRNSVRELLKDRAAESVRYWMRMVGGKQRRGAPRLQDQMGFYALGRYKKQKKLSYRDLANMLSPALFRDSKSPSPQTVQQAIMRAEKNLGTYVPKKKSSSSESRKV